MKRETRNCSNSWWSKNLCLGAVLVFVMVAGQLLAAPTAMAAKKEYNVGVLLYNDSRLSTLAGFREEMDKHEKEEGYTVVYDLKNAGADRPRLAEMAIEIIASRPDVAIACGGLEADALKEASAGTSVPVVFLAVSAAVDRGLAVEMTHPGGNLTGIETNDAILSGKRLWYLTKLLPDAKRVLVFHIPSIGASVESLEAARTAAAELGLELTVIEVANIEELKQAAQKITPAITDVVLLTPLAPLDATQKELFLPLSLLQKIPVMGYNEGSVNRGAFASYAGSRKEMGRQAVNLVHKLWQGTPVAGMAIETPEQIEFIINRWMIIRLGLKLPKSSWKMADKIVDIAF